MTRSSIFHRRLIHSLHIAAVAASLFALGAHAQTLRGVQPSAPIAAPKTSAVPSGSGLTSGSGGATLPSPAGLQSRFPAGVPSLSANPAGLPSPTRPNVSVPGVAAGSPVVDPGVAQKPVNGGGGLRTVVVAVQGPYTPTQIAGSFIGADADRNGELTRAEAQQLTILPLGFEDMDADRDGILTRSEYENAFR